MSMTRQLETIGQLSFSRADCLGSGRFGKVFIGKLTSDDGVIDVAIKRMKKEKTRLESILLLKANGHPNVINYYVTDESDVEFTYLAVELCMGTLNDLVCRGEDEKFSSLKNRSRVLDILRQITKGVRHLHLLKIVHGNLKPSNILVSYQRGDLEPMMKLADFAIRHAVRDQNGVTRFQLAFTEGWMCPTDDPIASSFDIFPLGCLYAFTASNGTHAFGSDHISRISNKRPMTLTLNQLVWDLQSISFLGLIGEMVNLNAEERPTVSEILAHPIFNQRSVPIASSQQPETRTDRRISRPSASAFHGQSPSTSSASFTTPIRKSATEPLDENSSNDATQIRSRLRGKQLKAAANTRTEPEKIANIDVAFKNPVASSSRPPSSSSSSSNDESVHSDSDSEDSDQADGETIPTGRNNKTFKCDICGNCYSSKQGISIHMNKHTGAKPFQCQYCDKTFHFPSSLYAHRKTHFPPTYKCDFCPKMFSAKSNRNKHMRTHTGAKPYRCEYCNKKFAYSSDLVRHRNTHSASKFKCPFCLKKFFRSDSCKTHWNGGKNGRIACKVRRQQLA